MGPEVMMAILGGVQLLSSLFSGKGGKNPIVPPETKPFQGYGQELVNSLTRSVNPSAVDQYTWSNAEQQGQGGFDIGTLLEMLMMQQMMKTPGKGMSNSFMGLGNWAGPSGAAGGITNPGGMVNTFDPTYFG